MTAATVREGGRRGREDSAQAQPDDQRGLYIIKIANIAGARRREQVQRETSGATLGSERWSRRPVCTYSRCRPARREHLVYSSDSSSTSASLPLFTSAQARDQLSYSLYHTACWYHPETDQDNQPLHQSATCFRVRLTQEWTRTWKGAGGAQGEEHVICGYKEAEKAYGIGNSKRQEGSPNFECCRAAVWL